MKPLYVLACVLAYTRAQELVSEVNEEVEAQSSQKPDEYLDHAWDLYKIHYSKYYANKTEEMSRRLLWEKNMKFISEHNMDFDLGQETFRLGANEYTDWTEDEYLEKLKYKVGSDDGLKIFEDDEKVKYKKELNYHRPYGRRIRNRNTNDSWVTAAVELIEARIAKEKMYTRLSEESVFECMNEDEPRTVESALRHIETNGVVTNASYATSEGKVGSCRKTDANKYLLKIVSINKVKEGSEKQLRKALKKYGPIAVAVNMSPNKLRFYKQGVVNLDKEQCSQSKDDLNQVMLLVGYSHLNNKRYWILHNSWSAKWGEHGYMYVQMGANVCGIANHAIFADIDLQNGVAM